jgi:hypothetical protein
MYVYVVVPMAWSGGVLVVELCEVRLDLVASQRLSEGGSDNYVLYMRDKLD